MSTGADRRRPQTAFSSSIEFDDEVLRGLLLHPDTPVEVDRSATRPRFAFARVGLVVATISGLCLVPTASLAEGTIETPPIDAVCQVSGIPVDPPPEADGECTGTTEPAPVPEGPPAPDDSPGAAVPPPPELEAVPAADLPAAPEQPPAPETAAVPEAAAAAAQAAAPAAPPATTQSAAPAPAPDTPQKPAAATKPATRERDTTNAGPRTRAAAPKSTRGRHRTMPPVAKIETPPSQDPLMPGLPHGPDEAPFFVTDEPIIPRFLIELYQEAGRRYHIPWPILAAINEIETDFGRNVAVSSAGAQGWMQFMPATWRAYGVDADSDGVKNPDDPRDAIFAAARYLRASGAPGNMRRAIFAYNHAGWYVDSVLLRAERIAEFQGDRSRTLRRLLRAGERRLVRQVLEDPRITVYECGREDIAAGRIDRRVLVVLRFLAWSGLHPTVTSLECGHGTYTSAGNVSAHSYGAAVDIGLVNGISILGNQGPGSVTDATIRELLTLRGAMAPAQIISLMAYDGADSTLAMADHADHIHVGFRPLADISR